MRYGHAANHAVRQKWRYPCCVPSFRRGEIDLVFFPGFVSNIEIYWEEPHFARWLRKLASFSRVITFDKRGTVRPRGLSGHAGAVKSGNNSRLAYCARLNGLPSSAADVGLLQAPIVKRNNTKETYLTRLMRPPDSSSHRPSEDLADRRQCTLALLPLRTVNRKFLSKPPPFAYVRFGSKADIRIAKGHVRFTPNSDRENRLPQKIMSALPPESGHVRCTSSCLLWANSGHQPYSITSSARPISVLGTVIPSVLATLRLIIKSTFAAC
jgi:hypothetical protein